MRLIVDLDWDNAHLQVADATFQYQLDQGGDDWLFRYDFLRNRPTDKPEAHLHVRGHLESKKFKLPATKWTLDDVHFPTAKRVSIESVIRLLADDFKVPCNSADVVEVDDRKKELWRAVLRESEQQGFF